ncbi:hypothetical protein KW868_02535 [Acinetobacter guillouiae]|uniref:Uncharacterized protein n=1 Tax=Acinetobacter guillouiae TaxID=106649 RepID=A0A8X8KFT1_ACIGI|nr:hypothetical protein [Acinetobacter guillouiae]MCF0263352.1 hypothetical protein [Acinetobacter guillouiae]
MNLISGKEALIALANGKEVEFYNPFEGNIGWKELGEFSTVRALLNDCFVCSDDGEEVKTKFRLKPRTITLNGIEVPAPFEPKEGESYFYIYPSADAGYGSATTIKLSKYLQFGAWRTEEEIKQVVDALRKVFKEPQQ